MKHTLINKKWYLACIVLIVVFQTSFAQSDSLVFDIGYKTFVVGEIKKMERGVLEVDVPYGDENFKIKWSEIKEIYTHSQFVVSIKGEI